MLYLQLKSDNIVLFDKNKFLNNIDDIIDNVLIDTNAGMNIIDSLRKNIEKSITHECKLNAPYCLSIKKHGKPIFYIEEAAKPKKILKFPIKNNEVFVER